MKFRSSLLALAFFIPSLISTTATALTLNAVDTGWYSEDGFHEPSNLNYIVGSSSGYRNFFVFDLTGIASATNATVSAYQMGVGSDGGPTYSSQTPSMSWELWDVTTDISTLTNGSGGFSAYDDLGSGTLYGSVNVFEDLNGRFFNVSLNAAGLASLNSATGLWAVGGAIVEPLGYAFGYSHEDARVRLNLDVNAIPLPAAAWLFGSALIPLVGVGRRKLGKTV